jgi:threonine/homoserine/homoserine lactone efflux protein
MALELWLAFAAASTALLAIPGPTVMLVVSYALGQGRASGWATVPGVTLGDFTAMTISLAGAELFTVLKLCGAAYLIWLGVKLWRAEPQPPGALNFRQRGQARAMFANAFAVTALNPKSIVFFVAFVPQFVDPASPALPQFVVLEATFLALAAANAALWAVLAGEMRERFRKPATLRVLNRTGAGFLIGAGVLTALARR